MARRVGHFLPAQVELAQCFRRGGQFRSFAGLFFGLERRHDGFGHRDELLLLLRVGEAAPVVHVAQMLHARRNRFLLHAQRGNGLGHFLRVIARTRFFKRGHHIAQYAFTLAQRDRFGFGCALRAFGQALELHGQIELRFLSCFAYRRLTRFERA